MAFFINECVFNQACGVINQFTKLRRDLTTGFFCKCSFCQKSYPDVLCGHHSGLGNNVDVHQVFDFCHQLRYNQHQRRKNFNASKVIASITGTSRDARILRKYTPINVF